jgi:hypothetical protein
VAAHRALSRLAFAAASAVAVFALGAGAPEPRRIALRFSENISAVPALERLVARAKGRGIELQEAPEATAIPRGFDVAHVWVLPVPEKAKPLLGRFPISFEGAGFTFDGRTFTGKSDALVVVDPSKPGETFVLGVSEDAVLELTAAWLLDRSQRPADYQVVSGELTKDGRFVGRDSRLAIDRATDRDRIAAREDFYKALRHEKRGGVDWEYRESESSAVARFEKAAARYAGKKGFTVRLFPDAAAKALDTGSSRPADLVSDGGKLVVEVDASTPAEPDLVEPVLAAAGLAAANPALLERRTLLLAAGARRCGKWWGRDARGFAAFVHAAGVDPSLEDVVRGSEDASPILTVGAAAGWLDAGVRLESEALVEKSLTEPEGVLATKLARWRETAWRQTVKPPPRRPLPDGFLRGVSYAMSNTLDEGYASPASLATLQRLKELAVNAVAVMPYGLAKEAAGDRILFVHRSARGETDEGILRAVTDARSLGMTAMVNPQLWVSGGAPVRDIAMPDEKTWRSWFDAYRRYVVHAAVVAEAAGAALFCVGTELSKTEDHEKEWRDTIAAVRLASGAPLVYAANGAAGAQRVTFWDVLDAIGVDFYDPLSKGEKAKDAALEEGVRQAARPVAELAARVNKPVVFTQAGYASIRGAFMAPRDDDSRRPAGGEDAARAIAAVCRVLGKESWWKGVYWWKVPSDGKPALAGERGFNLLGAPAEKAMGEAYRRMSAP